MAPWITESKAPRMSGKTPRANSPLETDSLILDTNACRAESVEEPALYACTQHLLQHKIKHQYDKEVYTDGSKNKGKKVGFATVFTDITRRETL